MHMRLEELELSLNMEPINAAELGPRTAAARRWLFAGMSEEELLGGTRRTERLL